jgi:hypothetical protein
MPLVFTRGTIGGQAYIMSNSIRPAAMCATERKALRRRCSFRS